MNFVTWTEQSWIIFTSIAVGLGVIINFVRSVKLSKDVLLKPLNEINSKLDAFHEKQDIQTRAILTLQRISLLNSCSDFLHKGYATVNEKSTISSQYESYHELGGDSFITDMVKEVMKLPIEPEIEESK